MWDVKVLKYTKDPWVAYSSILTMWDVKTTSKQKTLTNLLLNGETSDESATEEL